MQEESSARDALSSCCFHSPQEKEALIIAVGAGRVSLPMVLRIMGEIMRMSCVISAPYQMKEVPGGPTDTAQQG